MMFINTLKYRLRFSISLTLAVTNFTPSLTLPIVSPHRHLHPFYHQRLLLPYIMYILFPYLQILGNVIIYLFLMFRY